MDKDQKKDQKKDGQTIETDGLKEDPGVKGAASDAEKKAQKQEKHFRDRIPNNHRYSVISFYVVFTVVVIFILIRIGDNLDKIALALGAGLHWLRVIFVPLALGFALAYLFAPVIHFFRRRLEKLPYYRKRDKSGVLCCNPGSISIPKEGSWHGYLLLTGRELLWKTLEGEIRHREVLGAK